MPPGTSRTFFRVKYRILQPAAPQMEGGGEPRLAGTNDHNIGNSVLRARIPPWVVHIPMLVAAHWPDDRPVRDSVSIADSGPVRS